MTRPSARALSLVIPAFDEEASLGRVLEDARRVLGGLDLEYEIVVVDDGSRDRTAEIARAAGVRLIQNVQNGGYGYCLMRGIRLARFPTIAIVDADGSYPLGDLTKLIEEYRRGVAMVVGERQGRSYLPSARIRLVRWVFRQLTQFIVGRRVPDVNSGMRVFRRGDVLPLLPHMSYGFSFTTSITLLFMLQALPVSYVPVQYHEREGDSKVRWFRDSLRALQILVSITARLNPIKLFLLAALAELTLLVPVALVAWPSGNFATPFAVVLAASGIIASLGFAVEALIDKSPFPSRDEADPEGDDAGGAPG